MIERRQLLISALGAGAAVAVPSAAHAAFPDIANLKSRPSGKIEVLYKTPHGKPNGLDVTPEGMWVMDQGPENMVSLINPETGKLIREYKPEGVLSASGIAIDGNTAWIGSTYNRFIVAVDNSNGKLIQKYSTPGAGQIYRTRMDKPGHRTPLQAAYPAPPPPPPPPPGATPRPTGGRGHGKQEATADAGPAGTGAHCILVKGDNLYVAVPPARMTFVIDKNTWVVQEMFPSAGDRPHDMSWSSPAKTHIWASDSNLNAFFLMDASTGAYSEKIQLPDDSPIIHGAKIHNGYMYYCDDVGWMCRFKM